MTSYDQALQPLLPLLRCPLCHLDEPLEVRSGPAPAELGQPLQDLHLRCPGCGASYPLTHDFIPILWDAELREAFGDAPRSGSQGRSTVDANKAIYDRVSDQYQRYVRQDGEHALRLRNAVQRIAALAGAPAAGPERLATPRYHVDFGCGPGHVLGWLKSCGLVQIGLDVSLENLRNARRQTGCLVVCGNASNMPFANASIDLVTESCALHHILDWQRAVTESVRICKRSGGILLDSEPSQAQMAWSRLAMLAFRARLPLYKLLSYVRHDKFIFRDLQQVQLNLQAEIHHQPGTGFPLEELRGLFTAAGFAAEIIQWPSPQLTSRPRPDWKAIVLSLLSGRNPWNPRYGAFLAIATARPTLAPPHRAKPDLHAALRPLRHEP